VRISAKSDYAIRAAAQLAAADGARTKAEDLAVAGDIPRQFLENILAELRRAGIVRAHRGSDGGYELALPARDIDLGMVLAAVGSPLAEIETRDNGWAAGAPLDDVWFALQSVTRTVLERITLADLCAGSLPADLRRLAREERARVD
jgi:Rrf2 family protein